MGEIDKGGVFLALGGKSVVDISDSFPSGGMVVTPDEERRMGKILQAEYDAYRQPRIEARKRVNQAYITPKPPTE